MSTNTRLGVWALCAALAGLCGCNQARLVSRDATGGVVAIPSNSDAWPCHHRQHAEELIQAQCPRGYVITKEEETVVRTVQHTNTNTQRTGDGLLAALHIAPVNEQTNQTTTSEDLKEWRIYFQGTDSTPASAAVPGPVAVRE